MPDLYDIAYRFRERCGRCTHNKCDWCEAASALSKLRKRTEALQRIFEAQLMPADWEGYAVKVRGIAREALSDG
jgi:hypothetical protein